MLLADNAASVLSAWASFYTTIGSSAAALTGLVFVVMTLITGEQKSSRPTHEGIATFSTPTVLHFSSALFISFVLNAPLHSLAQAAVLVGLVGVYGIVHIVQVLLRSQRLGGTYEPDLEDRVFYVILPFLAYGAILGGSAEMFFDAVQALFVVASGVVVLVFIGIRNAWDVVTYLAVEQANEAGDAAEGKSPRPGETQ